MDITPSRIGFIATHFNGHDHVSRESAVWHHALTEMGHECFFFSGEATQPEERSVIVPEADFRNQDIDQLNQELFSDGKRSSKTSGTIQALRFHIKQHLHQFIQTFDINLLVIENALSQPVNIPLGLALTEVIAETGITCFARHHDFAWEQPQFLHSPVKDYILSSFPPKLPSLQHVVASSAHADELATRVGVNALVIPYVRNFFEPPEEHPMTSHAFRDEVDVPHDVPLALSTSPLIPSSQIDTILALVARMERQPEFLLASVATVQQQAYLKYIMETAELLQSKAHLVGEWLRVLSKDSENLAALGLFYQNASYVFTMGQTQGSTAEALDAIYFGKPFISSKHNPALQDFKQLGIQYLEINSFPHLEAVQALEGTLKETEQLSAMTQDNFTLARQHFSLQILGQKLADALHSTLTS